MSETASPHRIGKFDFSVEVEKTKREPEERVAALTNWLLAEWGRKGSSKSELKSSATKA